MKFEISQLKASAAAPAKHEMWELVNKRIRTPQADFFDRFRKMGEVVLFRDTGRLIGFMGLSTKKAVVQGDKLNLIQIDHSYLHPSFRSHDLLRKAIAQAAQHLRLRNPLRKRYVWTAATTPEIYAEIGRMGSKFYPSPKYAPTEEIELIRTYIGNTTFGADYHSASGLVSLGEDRIDLPFTPSTADATTDPLVQFFSEKITQTPQNGKMGLLTLAPS